MSYLLESWAPPPSPATARKRRPAIIIAIACAAFLGLATAGFLIWHHADRQLSQRDAYNSVDKATIDVLHGLGQDPADHPVYAYVEHCDNGMGGYRGWRVVGNSSLTSVTPDQALTYGKQLDAYLRKNGYSNVQLTIDGNNVGVQGDHGSAGVYLTYRPKESNELLRFGSTTDCDVKPDNPAIQKQNYPLTDNQGHLLPNPGAGTTPAP